MAFKDSLKKLFREIGSRIELAGERAPGPFGLVISDRLKSEDKKNDEPPKPRP